MTWQKLFLKIQQQTITCLGTGLCSRRHRQTLLQIQRQKRGSFEKNTSGVRVQPRPSGDVLSRDCEAVDRFCCMLYKFSAIASLDADLVWLVWLVGANSQATLVVLLQPPPSPHFHSGPHTQRAAGVIVTMDMEAECCARAREEWAVYVLLSRDSLNHLPIVSHSQHFVFLTLFLSDYAKCLWRHLLSHYRHRHHHYRHHHHHHHHPQNAYTGLLANCSVCFRVMLVCLLNCRSS